MPLSAVWAGPARNTHPNGPPLLTAQTAGSTPFRFSTHAAERSWAAEWIAALLETEKVTVTPEVKDIVWSALIITKLISLREQCPQ
jgi:type IV secretory pathway VirB4 component